MLADLFKTLIEDLAFDTTSADVRCCVFKVSSFSYRGSLVGSSFLLSFRCKLLPKPYIHERIVELW